MSILKYKMYKAQLTHCKMAHLNGQLEQVVKSTYGNLLSPSIIFNCVDLYFVGENLPKNGKK